MGGPAGTKKNTAASLQSRSGVFPSPGTPSYRSSGASGYQKGWSSERVPLPANSSRRYIGLHPFNNGKPLPSKWDDAEKWISSPVTGDGTGRVVMPAPHYRRPKSKSGPLGPPGGIGRPYLAASPMVPCFDSGRVGGFAMGSPFLMGVMVQDRSYSSAGSGGGGEGGRRSCSANTEPYLVRSTSVHGWLDAMVEFSPSLPSSQGREQDEMPDCDIESAVMISPVVLRKDVATQMSPERSPSYSPKERHVCSPSPSARPIEKPENSFSRMEIRDVQVDDQDAPIRWTKKIVSRGADKHPIHLIQWKKKTAESKDSACEVAETSKKCLSNYKREEAKISAWEKSQSSKAEVAMRKLEMKLEKKRSSSMERILNKLRSAQREAQEMRSAAATSQPREVARTRRKKLSYFRRTGQMSGCFTCHAF